LLIKSNNFSDPTKGGESKKKNKTYTHLKMKYLLNAFGDVALKVSVVSKLLAPHRPSARKFLPYLLVGCLASAALPMTAASSVELDGAVSTNALTSNTSSNTIGLTHITGTGDNRLTLVGLSWNANTTARTISGITFTPDGGPAVNLALVRSQISAANTYRYAAIYAFTNPPAGQTGTVTATFSGSVANGIVIGAANFKGVDPTTPLGTSVGASATSGATISASLTGLNGNELVFDTVFVGGTPPPTPTANAGQTLLWNPTISNTRGVASSRQVTSNSFSASWTSGDSTRPWAIVAVPINPVADTTPPTVTINQASSQVDPTGELPINFTVTFKEPVSDFTNGDVTVSGTAGATTAVVTGSGTNYNVAVGGITQSGTVIVSIATGVAHDAAGNPNFASTSTDDTVTFNYVPDRTAIFSSAYPSGYLDPIHFTASVQTNGVTDATVTGTVTFLANGTSFSTNSLLGGTATSDNIANLLRGTNIITTFYSGNEIRAADTNDFTQIVTNHPPSVTGVSYNRDAAVNNLVIPISELLAAATDADGDALSLAGVSASTGEITPVISGGSLFYTNAAIVNDQFTFAVSDGFGGTNSAQVSIVVTNTLTTFTLTSSSPTNGYLANVTFTATLRTNGFLATTATSNVVFSANGIPFSTNALVSGSASASISTLPRNAANLITADYTGDGAFTPFTSLLNQAITNHPPVAGNISYKRGALTSTLNIPIADLLANVADADGDAVSLLGVSVTTSGIALGNDGTTLTYDNTNAVNDQFTFTVSDGFGGTNFATASIIGGNRHNILLIIADDLGADSLSLFNSTNNPGVSLPPTPNLEKLGRQGVLFPNFYARPSCSQFRACAFTGRHSFRTGVGTAISGSTTPSLRTNEYTLARALTANAPEYSLASFGKWHLRPTTELDSPWTTGGWPNFAGFFGVGVSSYTSWTKIKNGVSANTTTYSTSDQVNEAIAFIQSQGTNRWFTWLALNAPHSPRHKPPANLAPTYASLSGTSADITAQPRKYWEAMVEALDTEIGRLLTIVDTNDTDIIFVGDNGTERDVQQWPYKNSAVTETTTSNGHAKFTLFEGGERTPFFVTGPSVANGGRTNSSIVDAVDIFQLVQELAGVDVAATTPTNVIIDSQSILPALQGDVVVPRPYLFSEQFNQGTGDGFTIQNGKYKLLHFYSTHTERLYDLANDPYEYTNLLTAALTPVAQSNYNDLRIKVAPYLTLAASDRTRNLVPYPAINGISYTNGAFSVDAQFTQLSANGAFANANQPAATQYSLTGTNLNYQVVLWRSTELNNPLTWTPVATNIAAGLTTSFLQSTNGLLVDPNATDDHAFYRITHYTPYP